MLAHPHRKILLRAVVDQPNVPILYSTPGKWDMIYTKLNSFLETQGVTLHADQKSVLDQSKAFLEKKDASLNVGQWKALVGKLYTQREEREDMSIARDSTAMHGLNRCIAAKINSGSALSLV